MFHFIESHGGYRFQNFLKLLSRLAASPAVSGCVRLGPAGAGWFGFKMWSLTSPAVSCSLQSVMACMCVRVGLLVSGWVRLGRVRLAPAGLGCVRLCPAKSGCARLGPAVSGSRDSKVPKLQGSRVARF